MSVLPSGTVTFLFTDIEGSTKRWEEYTAAMQAALALHDALLHQVVLECGGHAFKTMGDATYAVFAAAPVAVAAAVAGQRALQAQRWPEEIGGLRVRMALHTGTAEARDGDYFGPPLNRVARLLSAGHGGQVLLSLATYELVRDQLPPEAEVRDLGQHRLKDLIRPEHIFQLTIPNLTAEFPLLKTLDSRANNLPAQQSAFIGRERELAAVRTLVERSDVRVVTLTGPGGTGKTRLSLQVAADLLDDFAQGVYFVPLAPIRDPALVVATIAQVLGLREAGDQPLQETVLSYVRDKELLLVLDNFEQVVAAAPEIGTLLSTAPRLKVLVTSRTALRVYGEQEFPIPPLTLPALHHLPTIAALTQYEAVALFIQRAQLTKPDFAVTNENAPAVAEICVRLDGLPLAIELAAARVKLLPPQALLTRLENRLTVLTGGARDRPARQQTLRGAIDWSYALLDPGEQTLFAWLSVCVGGCTIREYARERLAQSGTERTVRAAHAGHMLALAEEAEPYLRGPEQTTWLARLEAEHDNLRAALHWAMEPDASQELGLHIAAAVWQFWQVRSYLDEGRSWLEALLGRGGPRKSSVEAASIRATALTGAGILAEMQGDYAQARMVHEESLALRRELGDKRGIAASLNNLGVVADDQGDYARARVLYEESLALYRELGDKQGIAISLTNLGAVAYVLGDYAQARTLHEESLALYRELGHKRGIGASFDNLAEVAYVLGDYARARALYEESLALYRELGDKRSMASFALTGLGGVALAQGDYMRARLLYEESLCMSRELGDKQYIALSLEGLARVTSSSGTAPSVQGRAARLFGAAAALRAAIGAPLPPTEHADYERTMATLRTTLSDATYEAAWAEGQALNLENAITLALLGRHTE